MTDPVLHISPVAPEPLSREFFRDYMQLSKFRLSTSVVGTTIIAYFLGVVKNQMGVDYLGLFGLAIGGMLVTASANGFNQVLERDTDKLMSRTQGRPVAEGRMSVNDAVIFSAVCGFIGLICLAMLVNGRVALLSLLSLFTYVLCYTPLKKVTPWAVFVGAIPGALPPSIGWVAAVGHIDEMSWIFFCIQFFWQFPHFWAIAWILEDDYRKAGYTLLPSYEGRTKRNAMQIILYSVALMLISMAPIKVGFCSPNAMFVIIPLGCWLVYKSYKLYRNLDVKSARALMFSSLVYIPAVLLSYFL